MPDDSNYLQPTVSADRGWLHLEARYNYEAQQTASFWAGVNFEAGERVTLALTPMFGIVTGDTDGVAPGLLVTLATWKLELYSEAEWVVDSAETSDSFFYNWSELTLQPVEWFRFGLVDPAHARLPERPRHPTRPARRRDVAERVVHRARLRAVLGSADSGGVDRGAVLTDR